MQRVGTLNSQPSTLNLVYDGDGNKVRETVNGQTISYLIDTLNPTGYAQVVEELQNGTVIRTYTYGHDLLVQDQRDGAGTWSATWFGYDGHGSVRLLTNALGQITDRYDYDAFGVLLTSSGSTYNRYRYCGEQYDDALGLYYLRARFMNAANGRFWNMDSFEGEEGDPQSLHKYLYANADPVEGFDPSGNQTMSQTSATASIGAMLVSYALPALQVYNTITTALEGFATVLEVARALQDGDVGLDDIVDGLLEFAGEYLIDNLPESLAQFALGPSSSLDLPSEALQAAGLSRGLAKFVPKGFRIKRANARTALTWLNDLKLRNGNKSHVSGVNFDRQGFPDFTKYLRPGKNTVKIKLTGSRAQDSKEANRLMGFARTPRGYVWHHHQRLGVMQLVRKGPHIATGHSGGAKLWAILHGLPKYGD